MRIGLYMPALSPENGGGFTISDTILKALMTYPVKHEFYIFFLGENSYENTEYIKYIPLHEYDSIDTKASAKSKNKLFKALKRFIGFNKYDEKKSLNLNQFIQEYRIELFWFISAFYEPVDIPYIYTIWDLQHRLQPYFPEVSVTGWTWDDRENFYTSVIRKAAYIITANNTGKDELVKFYQVPEDRVVPLPHPTSLFAIQPENYIDEGSIDLTRYGTYIFYPAQFWPHKNHICILLALKYLKEKYRMSINAVFTGSDLGNMGYIKEKAAELGLNDQVVFLGFVNTGDLIRLYRGALALVFPTFFGPENLPPLEAFALGCPVIASDVSGAKEQFGDAALLFDPRDETQLANSIKKIVNSVKLRKTLIKRGSKRAKVWTPDDYIEGILAIIENFESIRRCWSSMDKYIHL